MGLVMWALGLEVKWFCEVLVIGFWIVIAWGIQVGLVPLL